MAEIDDRLVPLDGLAPCNIAFSKMEAIGGNAARFSFDITVEDAYAGTFAVEVEPSGSVDRMMVIAHERIIDMLRQLLFRADGLRKSYEMQAKQAAA